MCSQSIQLIHQYHLVKEALQEGITRFVVGAVIVHERKILLLRRPEGDFMGGIYELPSGKVEKGETFEEALVREVKEETGLEVVEIVGYIGSFDYLSQRGIKTRQFNFVVEVTPSQIQLQEHDAYAWVEIEKLNHYPVTPAVKRLLQQLTDNNPKD